MFDLPSIEGVEEVILNKEVINGKIKPLLIYSKGSAISSEKEKKILRDSAVKDITRNLPGTSGSISSSENIYMECKVVSKRSDK